MFRKSLQNMARGDIKGNIANKFRLKRVKYLMSLIENEKRKPVKILDIGGTDYYWSALNIDKYQELDITLVNISIPENIDKKFKYIQGDGRDLSYFQNKSVDLIFSNSVIEHTGNFNDQIKFANEIRRVSKKYFIQTPNYFFPFEPHFLVFGFQFLPIKFRAFLIRNLNFGWYKKTKDYNKSLELAKNIRLLKKKELKTLFPEGTIIKEKFCGLTKSFMIFYNGHEN